nr:hypothetical protein CJLB15_00031 [Campylobacter phage CJLB-15]
MICRLKIFSASNSVKLQISKSFESDNFKHKQIILTFYSQQFL